MQCLVIVRLLDRPVAPDLCWEPKQLRMGSECCFQLQHLGAAQGIYKLRLPPSPMASPEEVSTAFCRLASISHCTHKSTSGVIHKEGMERSEPAGIHCGLRSTLRKLSGLLVGWGSTAPESSGTGVGECWWLAWWLPANQSVMEMEVNQMTSNEPTKSPRAFSRKASHLSGPELCWGTGLCRAPGRQEPGTACSLLRWLFARCCMI